MTQCYLKNMCIFEYIMPTVQSPYLGTCRLRRKWGKTKEQGWIQSAVATLARQTPTSPCLRYLNTFQVSRYGNWTIELWSMTRRMKWAQHLSGSWKNNVKQDLRKIYDKFHDLLSICCSGKALEWSII